MKQDTKKKLKIGIIILVIVVILYFLVVSPILKFKQNERKVKDAIGRYYEINKAELPTGKKIKTVSLQTLYVKKFINDELRDPISQKACDSKLSWVKTKKENNEYKNYVYLKCGKFESKIDHDGPKIELNGKEEITVYKDEEYKDPGVKSVVDNTDGKMDIKTVQIDDSKLKTSKVGTYQIIYEAEDSFKNVTRKVRTVKVVETLNHIVEKDTKKTKIYQGLQYNNYIKLDGILFRIVGENEDGTVKVVTDTSISAISYEKKDDWLNDYFYNKLSKEVKDLIEESKWCDETVKDIKNIKKCNHYGKKQNVGVLSVFDINNSKDKDGATYLNDKMILSNLKDNQTNWIVKMYKIDEEDTHANVVVNPAVNIKKDMIVVSGDGSSEDPYILKGTQKKLKAGDKVNQARVGDYISYSSYLWRVESVEDGLTKVIMEDMIGIDGDDYSTNFSDKKPITYNPTEEGNLGYKINNEVSSYLSTKLFSSQKITVKDYDADIEYQAKSKDTEYKVKLFVPSMYELFSSSVPNYHWYRDYSSKNNNYCYMQFSGTVICEKNDPTAFQHVCLAGYLKESVQVKNGEGLEDNPYQISD